MISPPVQLKAKTGRERNTIAAYVFCVELQPVPLTEGNKKCPIQAE
jgi:hypothetical protein